MSNLHKSFGLKLLGVALCISSSLAISQSLPRGAATGASGITFVDGSSSKVIVEQNGQKYLVDVATRTVTEVTDASSSSLAGGESVSQSDPPAQATKPTTPAPPTPTTEQPNIYKAGDDLVF